MTSAVVEEGGRRLTSCRMESGLFAIMNQQRQRNPKLHRVTQSGPASRAGTCSNRSPSFHSVVITVIAVLWLEEFIVRQNSINLDRILA